MSFGVKSTITVNSDRTADHRPNHQNQYAGYNGHVLNNGTYSSHPNLRQQHRKLPATPNKPSSLRLGGGGGGGGGGMWRQSSLPEQHNPPGGQAARDVQPLQPSERHHRRLKPLTPTKPSTLSFRQSSALNGSPSYALFGAQPFQMPKVNSSPTTTAVIGNRTDTVLHFNGGNGLHHRTLPPMVDRRTNSLGRCLPQTPVPPPPPAPTKAPGGGGGGLGGLLGRGQETTDWI